nr:hypothetical protein [uncultured Agathobaculum sp.]
MYNRYLAESSADTPPQPEPSCRPSTSGQAAAALGGLTRGLSDRLQNLRLDTNTIIALVIVWFLLSDDGDVDWEQLIFIGVLLVLGV